MLQIQDTIVSLDIIEEFFCCDIEACKGECCIAGDAGAPLSEPEFEKISEILPKIDNYLTPAGKKALAEGGAGYYDQEGDLVTTLIEGAACAYTGFAPNGICYCTLEKAFNDGKTNFRKPISCALYPVRLKEYKIFTGVQLHKWKICKQAFALGRSKGIRVYQFLKQPLIQRFGQEWYDELDFTAKEYLKMKENGSLNIEK
ncbi:MAG: DUF3109 family protein [Prevotella sp.]|nr:DUF3109 family protein [Bacteroides sp.]MCM1367069.1 DUF3109 family protein [Prevotella sp.]MCM1437549.1 DUF3109 family protein [Prevotella sp.]